MKKNIGFWIVTLVLLGMMLGCTTDNKDKLDNLPPVTTEAADCAADGPGCKQFNPELK